MRPSPACGPWRLLARYHAGDALQRRLAAAHASIRAGDQVFEMEDINGEFQQADVAIVLGANDVLNPAALQEGSVIYGMPSGP